MSFDASSALRYAYDQALQVPCLVGVAPYSVYVIQTTGGLVGFDDTNTNRLVSETRITVSADGYNAAAPGDGYLNPILEEKFSKSLIVSNGQLLGEKFILGDLVFPYTWNGVTAGTDPTLFQPLPNSRLQLYVQVRGSGLATNGNFFTVDAVHTQDMTGISYTVALRTAPPIILTS